MHNQVKVLLPAALFEQAQDKQELQQLIVEYMKRYRGYRIIRVKDGFAECEMRG